MKKALTIVVALVLALTLGAVALNCGGDEEEKGCLNCACKDDGTCDGALVCEANVCVEDSGDCCPTALHIWVKGHTLALDMTPVPAALTPIKPMDALINPTPEHLKDTTAGTDGAFDTGCFDASLVSLGLVILADDTGFDGTGGNFFPTATGIAAWDDDTDKVCIEDAKAFVVDQGTITALTGAGLDPVANGFAMGFVLDASGSPVSGAVIKKGDGTDLAMVIYPNATMTAFDGTETSANGMYIIPGPLSLGTITPVKTGVTWRTGGYSAGTQAGFCYFLIMQSS